MYNSVNSEFLCAYVFSNILKCIINIFSVFSLSSRVYKL